MGARWVRLAAVFVVAVALFTIGFQAVMSSEAREATDIPRDTGCSVIGVVREGDYLTDLDPTTPLPAGAELVLIGDEEAEERFFERYVAHSQQGLRDRFRRLVASGRS